MQCKPLSVECCIYSLFNRVCIRGFSFYKAIKLTVIIGGTRIAVLSNISRCFSAGGVTDANGLLLAVVSDGANVHDIKLVHQTLDA